jgi:hypothetical protein
MWWAGPIEVDGWDLLNVLGGFFLLPLVAAATATFLVSRRFQPRLRALKIAGFFMLVFVGAAVGWGFLMVNISGGIFDQTFWS